jgi:Taurine catabolism dioxygenase TauD, TfdA family
MRIPDPYYIVKMPLDEFILGMLELGTPLETSIVGVFDTEGRGSRRDIDLPLHQDGVYSEALAKAQGGTYVAKEGIDIVGLYCIRGGDDSCVTIVDDQEIVLQAGEALVFDNHQVLHGRRGSVGERILLRVWINVAK